MRASSGMPIVFLLIRCVVIPNYQQSDTILDICYQQSLEPKSTPFVCRIPPCATGTGHDCIIIVYTWQRCMKQRRVEVEVSYNFVFISKGMLNMAGMHGWITVWGFIVILRLKRWTTGTWGLWHQGMWLYRHGRGKVFILHWNGPCSFSSLFWPRFNETVPKSDVTLYGQDSHVAAHSTG